MESLNLNTLASSLQAGSSSSVTLQNAEQELLNNFKAAALSITTLYRSARHTSERAYNAGYAAACQDLLMMIQHGVSANTSQEQESSMNIGRVMDWIEARLEAIKSREEEEDEDEEREKEKSKNMKTKTTATTGSQAPAPSILSHQSNSARHNAPAPPPVPAPQPPKPSATAVTPKETATPVQQQPQFTFNASLSPPPLTTTTTEISPSVNVTAGAKRRHAVMMMLDSASTANGHGEPSILDGTNLNLNVGALGHSQRRRTRSSTRMVFGQSQGGGDSLGAAMDVEEEGRERKRPARR